MNVRWNPPDSEAQYLQALNTCFPSWGDATTYAWCFQRDAGAGAADLMVLDEDGDIIAGSAVTYRVLQSAEGQAFTAGIMTGSWTLPAARGKGCFTRVIEASVEACIRRDAAVLLAFVTHTNPSYRRLAAAGSTLVPSWYVTSTLDTPPAPADSPSEEPPPAATRFLYPEREHWLGQFVKRPLPTRVAAGGLLEEAATSDRLLYGDVPLAPLLAQAQARQRHLFYYTNRPTRRDEGIGLGMTAHPGSLTVLPAKAPDVAAAIGSTLWDVQTGDRM